MYFSLRTILNLALSSLAIGAVASVPAFAQDEADSGEATQKLIETVERRPPGTDRDTWRESRRDAARELGSIGDKAAVPVLIKVVREEKFDALAQIAIVSLGKLGDKAAIPVLQEVVADSSRDRFVRNSAKDALRKLGAKVESESASSDDDSEKTLATTGLASSTAATTSNTTVALVDDFGSEMLAASDRLVFAVGESHLGYDSVSGESFLDGQASASFVRIREGKKVALRYEGRGDLVAGVINYEGDASRAQIASLNAAGSAEVRGYSGNLFGIGIGTALLGTDYLRIKRPGAAENTSSTLLSGELAVALGGGYGRIVDIGERIRVQRLERVLTQRKLLGRTISSSLAQELMRAWWKLRSEVGYHDRLVATVKILRDAGALLSEPDAGASYALLQVLRDGQVNYRQSGLQAYAALGESYLIRDEDLGLQDGRIESLFSKVSYGRQNDGGDSELVVDGFARLRILAEDGIASPWAAGVQSHWRNYRYGDAFDPLGALDIGVQAGVSSEGADDSELTTVVGGSLGWIWVSSRASRFRLAGEARLESSEIFAGVTFSGQYGFLDAAYVGAGLP